MNLNQVTVPTKNVEASIEFYQKLGLKLLVKSPHYARFLCPEGDSTFSIHLQEKLPAGEGVYVYFESEDLDEEVERLIASGIKFEHKAQDQSWLWREARLKDPDGNQIILYYAGVNRKDPPWRLED
ncbi:MAG: VOC family protein [Bacteroidota bacterium]